MTHPVPIRFIETDLDQLVTTAGRIALVADAPGAPGPAARRLDKAMKGALVRALTSEAFGRLKPGEAMELAFPSGLACEALMALGGAMAALDRRYRRKVASAANASIGKGLTA